MPYPWDDGRVGKQDGSARQVTATPVDDPLAHIIHVDMDAFFVSVELLTRPELANRPVIVGRIGSRSVVAAANYPARRFGVNSAMPMSIALRRCPQAVVIEPHFDRYLKYSAQVMGILDRFTPLVERLSVDEAFLDVSGSRRLFGSPFQIGTILREQVYTETGLRCSVGVAASKFVAKLASAKAKPDGLLLVPASVTLEFLHPLPVSALWGVGGKSEQALNRLGVRTVADFAQTPITVLRRALGEAVAERLYELSWGRDERSVTPGLDEKSISREKTFATDLVDQEELHRVLLELSNHLGARLRRSGVAARTVTLKLRFADFTTVTRSRSFSEAIDLSRGIWVQALRLYAQANPALRPVRLLGLRAENLVGERRVLGLWDEDVNWREAELAVDAISDRFGDGTIRPASLLDFGSQPE